MTIPPHQSSHNICSLSDLVAIFKRARWKIATAALLGASAMAFLSLKEHPKYTLQASFREKSSSRSGLGAAHSSLSVMLLNSAGDSDNGTISTLKSRQMMSKLIHAEGLQGQISQHGQHASLWQRIVQNLRIEYARWMNRRQPTIDDPIHPLRFQAVKYHGEIPISLKVLFNDDTHFEVQNDQSQTVGDGTLDTPFISQHYQFTLTRDDTSESLIQKHFDVTLLPLAFTAQDFATLFAIAPDLEDKSLLLLKLRYPERQRGVSCLNTLMHLYQEHLHHEHQRLINEQLSYLQKRQNEVNDHLQLMMGTYAENLSTEFSLLGFIDTQRAMEFLSGHQHSIKSKQLTLDLEIQRLQQARSDGKFYFDTLTTNTDTSFLNQLLWQIRELKQRHDSIQVALSSSHKALPQEQQLFFEEHIAELTHLQKTQNATSELLAMLESDTLPEELPSDLDMPQYMIKSWHTKLQKLAEIRTLEHNAETTAEWQAVKNRYLTYLNNFLHHLQVHTTTIEESLAHHHNPKPELQGINLDIAQELFLMYSKSTNDLEEQILQHNFVIEQIKQPQFEITSLSTILTDPVSQAAAVDATELALAVKDRSNRSHKEVERLEEELRMQRDFLSMHLTQARDLLKLRFGLFQNKLNSVQLATLALIQQQIGVTQNQLEEYVTQKISNLQQEYTLLVKQQEDLQAQMTLLPEKWVEEQLIYQQMDINRQMGREITNLVESKNISSNLEIVQSAPVDIAIAPLHPDSPRILLFALLGAAASTLAMMGWVAVNTLTRGIPASYDNLRQAGFTVVQSTSLRRLATYLATTPESPTHRTLLLTTGTAAPYNIALATSLARQGAKVAVVYTDNQAKSNTDVNASSSWEITISPQKTGYDIVLCPALNTADTIDNLYTLAFKTLLKDLSQSYDWVMLSLPLMADDPILPSIIDRFDYAIVTVQDQPLPALQELLQKAQQRTNGSSIIFNT